MSTTPVYIAFAIAMVLYLGLGVTLFKRIIPNTDNIKSLFSNDPVLAMGLAYLSVLMVIISVFYWIMIRFRGNHHCDALSTAINGRLVSLTSTDATAALTLKEYYVKSAYNACSSGDYRGDFVDLCALTYALKQGVRLVDFEIVNIEGHPAVISSASGSNTKETYNHLWWSDVLKHLQTHAFSASNAPNYNDPLFIHLRIQSNDTAIYDRMAEAFESLPPALLLDSQYSYENGGKSLGNVLMSQLSKKMVILVDRSNATYLESKSFCEYVNGASGTAYIRLLRSSDLKNNGDLTELTEFGRTGMTILMPDIGNNPANPNFTQANGAGVQFVAMRLKPMNDYGQAAFFDAALAGIVVKPASLRPIPVQVSVPNPDPSVSFENKQASGPTWNLPV